MFALFSALLTSTYLAIVEIIKKIIHEQVQDISR